MKKILFFGGFCFHYLATASAAAAAAGFDFHLTVWEFAEFSSLGVAELRSFERIQGRRIAAGIEQASLGIGFLSLLLLACMHAYNLSILFSAVYC